MKLEQTRVGIFDFSFLNNSVSLSAPQSCAVLPTEYLSATRSKSLRWPGVNAGNRVFSAKFGIRGADAHYEKIQRTRPKIFKKRKEMTWTNLDLMSQNQPRQPQIWSEVTDFGRMRVQKATARRNPFFDCGLFAKFGNLFPLVSRASDQRWLINSTCFLFNRSEIDSGISGFFFLKNKL